MIKCISVNSQVAHIFFTGMQLFVSQGPCWSNVTVEKHVPCACNKSCFPPSKTANCQKIVQLFLLKVHLHMFDAINKGRAVPIRWVSMLLENTLCCLKKYIVLLDNTLAVEDAHRYPKNIFTYNNMFDNIMTFVSWLVLEEIALT